VGRRLAEAERRWQAFGALADRLVQTIIRPRLERLAGYFENAHLLAPAESPRYRCVCHFRHTDRFPATTTLSLAVALPGQAPRLAIHPYPNQYTAPFRLLDGTEVTVRAIRPEDEPLIIALHAGHSEHTIRMRFFSLVKTLLASDLPLNNVPR